MDNSFVNRQMLVNSTQDKNNIFFFKIIFFIHLLRLLLHLEGILTCETISETFTNCTFFKFYSTMQHESLLLFCQTELMQWMNIVIWIEKWNNGLVMSTNNWHAHLEPQCSSKTRKKVQFGQSHCLYRLKSRVLVRHRIVATLS